MKLFGQEINFGFKAGTADPVATEVTGDVYTNRQISTEDGILKSYIPNFLYKPPFGYPRKENIPLIRQLARNPYIYSVVKTLGDEVAANPWDVVLKEGQEMTPQREKDLASIKEFFKNPNQNKEGFGFLLRAAIKDILEVDAGVWVKVFNEAGEFKQMFARDGGTFLKNPDVFGYMGYRAEYVPPLDPAYFDADMESASWNTTMNRYSMTYKDIAAYFQYGWTGASVPVPYGRKEIIYMMNNPQTTSIYGISPVSILADVIMTLVFGSQYNLDFYQNNNMPEGIISIIDANQESVTAFRQQMDKVVRKVDEATGFMRKIGFRIPITNKKAEFTQFQLDPEAMQVLEQQEWFTKIVWMCFGVTADEMGFTENSNRATTETQVSVSRRKAVKPLLEIIKYNIDLSIIPEWGDDAYEAFEFKWIEYDLKEDLQKHELYQKKLDMGIATPAMIAEEEGVDWEEVKEYQDEQHARNVEKAAANAARFQQTIGQNKEEDSDDEEMKSLDAQWKAESFENDLEEELVQNVKKRAKELAKDLERQNNPNLDKIQ